MQLTGAVIREQGVTFAIIAVKPYLIQNSNEAQKTISGLVPVFGVPVVLMAQDGWGAPTYYGRKDIAEFMSHVPIEAIPRRQYTIN